MGNKIQQLEKQIEAEKSKIKKDFLKGIKNLYGLKIGDEVEYKDIERVNDYDYKIYWSKGKIYDFEKNNESVFVKIYGKHDKLIITNCKLYNPDDYTLRHSIWDRELDVEDSFKLIVDKPKSTKEKVYTIFKVIKERNENIEYWYYNDHDKPQTVYEGEFHVITERL